MDKTTEYKLAHIKQWIEEYDLCDPLYRICMWPDAKEILLGIFGQAIAEAEAETPHTEAEAMAKFKERMARLKERIEAAAYRSRSDGQPIPIAAGLEAPGIVRPVPNPSDTPV